jgi:hypothetical protein
MEVLLLGVLLGFPVVVFGSLGVYAYLDAPNFDMDPVKWGLISALVPFFGFFAYLFEREERTPDTDREEMFVDGPFEVHKSKADEMPFTSESPETEQSESPVESDRPK